MGNIVSRLELSDSLKRRRILLGILVMVPLMSDELVFEIPLLVLSIIELTEPPNESPIPFFAMSLLLARERAYLQPLGKHVP